MSVASIGTSLSVVYLHERDDASSSDTSSSSEASEATTTKDSSSSGSKTSSAEKSSSSTSKLSLQSLSSSSSSSSSAKSALPKMPTLSSSYTIPTVTVPPNSDNPFIHRTSNPSGTVFIAFAGIIGFAMVVVMLIWLFTSLTNRKNATTGYFGANAPIEKEFHNFTAANNATSDGALYASNPFLSGYSDYSGLNRTTTNLGMSNYSHSRTNSQLGLEPLNSKGTNSIGGLTSDRNSVDVDAAAAAAAANRKSMFISPTAELLQKHKSANNGMYNLDILGQSGSNLMLNDLSNKTSMANDGGDEIAEPERANLSTTSINAIPGGRRGRTIPSMFLEDMFDQDAFSDSPKNNKVV